MKNRTVVASLSRLACALIAAFIAAVIAAGCGRSEEIQRYTVAKQPVIVAESVPNADPADADPDVDMTRDRMIAAIVPRGPKTWFFKVSGPNQVIADLMEEFLALIRSIKFNGPEGAPEWTLPDGWRQEKPTTQMRFATIKFDAGDQLLDLSVIPLPTGTGDLQEYILSNVNRWRGQLRLPVIEKDRLFRPEMKTEETVQLDLEDGTKVTLVNLVGYMGSGGMSRAPFAPFASKAANASTASVGGVPKPKPSNLKFTLPDGWKTTAGTAFSKAAFAVEDGNERAVITVSDLPATAAALLLNINRWRNQIGLANIDQSQLERERQKIPLGALDGDYFKLVGPKTTNPQKTILGVIAVDGQKAWFIKLLGESRLAAREEGRFTEFVKSMRFNGTGADDVK